MKLNAQKHNANVHHFAQEVLWRKAYDCTCLNKYSGASDIECTHCFGMGHIWDKPIKSAIGVLPQKAQKEWAQFGMYESGDILVSIPSDVSVYGIGEFDRITLTHATHPFSLTLVKGESESISGLATEFCRVFWIDQNDDIIDSVLPSCDEDGLVWSGDENDPPAGVRYSITGRRNPEYFSIPEIPYDRPHHMGEPLPRKVVLRRYDLFERGMK